MRFVAVIPARFSSARLPGKPLLEIAGKPMIQWVYERVSRASRLDDLLVATDDPRVLGAVEHFGGKAVMTRPDHRSGTDRVAELARSLEADVFVNVQADQPLISPDIIDCVCAPFEADATVQMTTAKIQLTDSTQIENPNIVKVVVNEENRAIYFSRAVIPYPRHSPASYFKHLGIYGYRRELLLVLDQLRPSKLETIESLEQLRFLENDIPIEVIDVDEDSLAVDSAEDIDRVRPLLENESRTSEEPLIGRRDAN